MSTYEQLKGLKVKYLSADTSGDRSVEGELFYNSSDFGLKSHIAVGAFSSGGSMLTARRAMSGGAGTQTAGLIAGGYISDFQNATEEYNGTGWAAGGNIPTALYYISVAGTQTAGLAIGGGDPVKQETLEYNGSAWTDVGNAPEIRKMLGRAGTQTASLFAGGNDGPNAASSEAFIYDGTNFTNITDLPSNRGGGHLSGGSQTASVHAGGSLGPPGLATTTVEWDGSSWSEGGSYPLPGQNQHSSSPSGYNQFVGGGYVSSAVSNKTLFYDGSTWSALADMGTARQQGAGFGSEIAAAFCGGTTGSVTTATEEFNVTTSTITAGAWASGGVLPAVNNGLAGAGTQTAALAFGSRTPGQTQKTNEYNGSSWTASNDINYAAGNSAGLGTQTAAVSIGGGDGGASNNASSSYNGTSWTSNNTLNGARSLAGGAGTDAAGLANGGFANPPGAVLNTSEHWDSTSWTTSNNMNTARMGCSSAGTQANAVTFGGIDYPAGTFYANAEDYNGSTWTNGSSMNAVRNMYNGGDGVAASAAWAIGGDASSNPLGSDTTFVELYNETVWVTQPPLATGRRSGATSKHGTSSATLFFGGRNGNSDKNLTEEFTGETTAVNAAKTIDFD